MKEVIVPVRRVLIDIRNGMSDQELTKKYGLSSAGLHDLRKQLIQAGMIEQVAGGYRVPHTRKINTLDVISDIRSRMSISHLMEKYTDSAKRLETLFRQLMAGGHVTQEELEPIAQDAADTGALIPVRRFPRFQPPLPLAVLTGITSFPGRVVDISASGLRVCGVTPLPTTMVRITVLGDEFGEFEPFEFFGECRWSTTNSANDFEAGFEIVKISAIDLHKLLRTLESCEDDLRNGTKRFLE